MVKIMEFLLPFDEVDVVSNMIEAPGSPQKQPTVSNCHNLRRFGFLKPEGVKLSIVPLEEEEATVAMAADEVQTNESLNVHALGRRASSRKIAKWHNEKIK